MTKPVETAILAGGCFWGVRDLIRKRPGVISTRVGYTGAEAPNATYRNHPGHAEAIQIRSDPELLSYRDLLEFFFQIHDPTTKNRQGNDIGGPATGQPSSTRPTSSERSPRTPSLTSTRPGSGPGKWSLRFRRPGSGRPNPSIRTTSNGIPMGTPAISFGRIGSCLAGRVRRQGDDTLRQGRCHWDQGLLDLASLPPDDEFDPGLAAFFQTSGRPESAARVRYLFENGFQTPNGVELDLGPAVGQSAFLP